MRINTLKYILKEGFKGLFRNKWYTLASIATISACLFLLGIFMAIMMNFQHIVDNVQKGVAVTTFFTEETTEEEILGLKTQLEARNEIERVVYVSCDPATLARDIKIFTEQGYELKEYTPADLFPRTAHVESVVCLSREKDDDYIRISVHTKDLQMKAN